MIGHIVWWTLLPEVNGQKASDNAARMKEMVEQLPFKISVIRDFHVSTQIIESTMNVEVVLFSTFDSLEDLQTYQKHPEHQKCVDFIRSVVSSRNVIDYIF